MGNPDITKEMLNGFQGKTRIFGQHGNGVNKSIDMVSDPIEKAIWFELRNRGSMMYIGPSLDEAIEIFNNIN